MDKTNRRDFLLSTGLLTAGIALSDIAARQAFACTTDVQNSTVAKVNLLPRYDRFFSLADSFAYPGTGSYDMIIWLPKSSTNVKLRLWMKTAAAKPEIEFSGRKRHTPVGKSPTDSTWKDFGIINRTSEEFGIKGFACMRVYGLSVSHARNSHVVFTAQTDVLLSGSITAAEKTLCGITRSDAGRTRISPSRVPVYTPTEFTLCYEAGLQGLPAGSLLRLAFPRAFSMPQNSDRKAEGWIDVSEAKSQVKFVSVRRSIESHERRDAIFVLPEGLKPQERVYFRYQTARTYLFTHQWSHADRPYWWSELPPMAVAVAVDDRHRFVAPLHENSHAVEFTPGPAERLLLFLPGRIRQKPHHCLNGVFTDRFRNVPPAPGSVNGNISVRLLGKQTIELESAHSCFGRWYRFSIPLPALPPGVYRAQAYDPETKAVLAESNPMEIMASGDNRPGIYWGQIHCHSEQSDGTGRYEDIYLNSRDNGFLDFTAASDHAEYFSDNEWLWMQDMNNRFNEEGRFVTLNGYERAGDQGHWNFYSSADRLELFRGMDMDPGHNTLKSACQQLSSRTDVAAGPHVHHGRFSEEYKSEIQCFHEICSQWGNYEKLTFDILNSGNVIGITGGGDNHEARGGFSCEDPDGQGVTAHTFSAGLKWKTGVTAAVMPELERQELITALLERRTYATTGPRILMDFRVGDKFMGGRTTNRKPIISAGINAVSEIDRLEIIRDGKVIHSVSGKGKDATVKWTDATAAGRHWYMLKVIQKDKEMAWTSPVWVMAEMAVL